MNRLFTRISNTLALLASLLLPVQQSLAASCCGYGAQGRAIQTSADSLRNNCSQHDKVRCCSEASGLERSCCKGDAPNSKLELSQCSDGCHESGPPNTADPAVVSSCLEDELPVVTANGISALVCENTTLNSPANTVDTRSESGSERCVRLCRYLL